MNRILIYSLIVLVFFLRGDLPFYHIDFSPSKLIPLVASLLLYRQKFFVNINQRSNAFLLKIFFYISLMNIFLNIYFYPENIYQISLMFLEVLLNYLVFILAYNLYYQYGLINISKLHFFSSVVFAFPILILSFSLTKVRRIGAGGDFEASLPVAVNHIGHSLGLCVIFGFFYLILSKKSIVSIKFKIYCMCMGLVFIAMVLTGSKAAFLGFILFVFVIFNQFFNIRNMLSISIVLVFVILFVDLTKYHNLFDRFLFESFIRGITQRIDSLYVAFSSLKGDLSFFGYPWRYQLINPENPIVYPHNFYISILLHLGVLPLIIFGIYTIKIFFILIMNPFIKNRFESKILLSMFFMVLIYVLTSGRLTRVMTIFWIFGFIDAYIDSLLIYRPLQKR